jgi:hypothetical protein
MKLVFFDEAKNDDSYPHYHIGGVGVDEVHLGEIERRINEVAARAFGHSSLVRGTELHAAEIFHRKNHFKEWNDFSSRISLLDDMMQILTAPEVMLNRPGIRGGSNS